MIKKILLGLLAVLVLLQLIPPDRSNPPVKPGMDFLQAKNAPDNVSKLFKAACYDCHSNETNYPWYSRVQPLGWWLAGHVNNGRRGLNLSDWGGFSPEKKATVIDDCIEFIEKDWMPLDSYENMHPEAVLSKDDVTMLVAWLKSVR